MKKIVAVVPMKLNSQRLPQKNMKCFTNGGPLCSYILKTLQKIPVIQEIYVYCSQDHIRSCLPDGIKYLQRSASLDRDDAQMNEVLRCFAEEIFADVYVMTHATSPFVKPQTIQKGLEAVLSGKYDSAFAAEKIQGFLWMNGMPFNYELNAIPRTQDMQPVYKETSGFYIYERNVMIQKGQRIGKRPYMVETGKIEAVDIDELEDFLIANAIYNFESGRLI